MNSTPFLAITSAILALISTWTHAQEAPATGLSLEDVAVSIDKDAFVDWQRTNSAVFEIQDEIIREIFRSAAMEGAERSMTGARPTILSINITYFDILSDLEKFFCCAKNEVMADYQLLDATTGAPLSSPKTLHFDHIGRGGFLLLVYPMPEDMQLGYLFQLIADGTQNWLSNGG